MHNVAITDLSKYTADSKRISFSSLSWANFDLVTYKKLLDLQGLEGAWETILKLISNLTVDEMNRSLIQFNDLGELYEIGLAHTNKITKKQMGKYYTPHDVAAVMSELLLENDNITNLVDVASGTGNLILEVLNQMLARYTRDTVIDFIKSKKLWLYDSDSVALKICVTKIEILLQQKLKKYINVVNADFLDASVKLPIDSTVITNPPYSVVKDTDFKETWFKSEVLAQSRDLYAGFFDKIASSARNAVLVTPQSFLVADKFSKLRTKLGNHYYGEIYSFDNVPGTLFNGRKHGIFNTNTSNGVRAAISSIKRNGHNGFRLTHLIRFNTKQRNEVINLDFMRSKLGNSVQDLKLPVKSFRELEPLVLETLSQPHIYLYDLIETNEEVQNPNYKITINTSARYFTVGSVRTLDRDGFFDIYAKDAASFNLLYALVNSSYVYMWWRFFDGGILYAKRHLLKTPVSVEILNRHNAIAPIVHEMIERENNYLSYKLNAGKNQESIKFPVRYRNLINRTLFPENAAYFDMLHRNYEVR